jgi:hypothetical protein
MPESPQVIVNGVDLTGIDLSHGLSVSSVAGHVVVNGQELPVSDTTQSLMLQGTTVTIQTADTGAATAFSGGNVTVESRGFIIGDIHTADGLVLLDLNNTSSADASSSVVVAAAPAMGFDLHDLHLFTDQAVPSFDSHLGFGPDWLFQ